MDIVGSQCYHLSTHSLFIGIVAYTEVAQMWSHILGMDSQCGRFLIAIFCGAEPKSPKSKRGKTIRVGISKEGCLVQVKHKLEESKVTSRTRWLRER